VTSSAGTGTGKARDSAFPFAVLLFTAGLAAVGVTAALLIPDDPGIGDLPWPAVLTFLVLLTGAGFPTLQFQWSEQGNAEDLFEAILAPTIFVLPPLAAVLVVGAAQTLSEGLQRIHPVKAAFNVAQWMAAAAAGSIVLSALRDQAVPPTTRDLLALAAAMVATTAVNVLAFVGILWLSGSESLGSVLASVRPWRCPSGSSAGSSTWPSGCCSWPPTPGPPGRPGCSWSRWRCCTGPAGRSPASGPTGPAWPACSGPPTPSPCP
jgi:hypothetical protein